MVSHQNVSSVEEDFFFSILLRVQRRLLVEGPHLAPIELDDELVLGDAVLGAVAAFLVVGRRLVLVDEGADLALADAPLPEADPVRVGGDEEALAGEAAALKAVLKWKRVRRIGLLCR